MSPQLAFILQSTELSLGLTFWICAVIAVACALGMVFSKRPVRSAISLAGLMVALAAIYASLNAPFLFVVQIIVYTGAVLMLFLFVVMLVGIDVRETAVAVFSKHFVLSVAAAVVLLPLLVVEVLQFVSFANNDKTLFAINLESTDNISGIAKLLFSDYVFAFEVTSALLITGVVGAMLLAHKERLSERITQAQLQRNRVTDFATKGKHPGAKPSSGVYALDNSIAAPALLPDGSPAPTSIPVAMAARGAVNDPQAALAATNAVYTEFDKATDAESVTGNSREELEK